MDYSKITLGQLLSSENETIKRHAIGILKQYQNIEYRNNADNYNRNPKAYVRRYEYELKQKTL